MDTSKIKAIFKAIECKSMSKAAETLSYTPSAMSHIVDAVEKELGVRILKRTPLGVEWSEYGLHLEPSLRRLVEAEDELMASAEAIVMQSEHQLRIGTYSSISYKILPELLKGFKTEYPNITVSIFIGNNLKDWIGSDIVDVTFDDVSGVQGNEWIPIMKDYYCAVMPTGILEGEKTVKREQLCRYPFIMVNDSHTRDYFLDLEFSETIKFTSVDDSSVLSMVKEGIGVSVLPSLSVTKHLRGIHTAKLEPALYRTLGISYKKKTHHPFAVEKFIQYLEKHYEK